MIFPLFLVWGVSILWHSGSLKYNAEAGFMEEWLLTKAHRPFFSSPAAFTPVHFCSLSITNVSFSLQTSAMEPNSRFDYLLLGWTYCVRLQGNPPSLFRIPSRSLGSILLFFSLLCFAFHSSLHSSLLSFLHSFIQSFIPQKAAKHILQLFIIYSITFPRI